ncbi:MAG: hypothetical protein AVDCRST_MAG64-1855, partial [uncultured Phycisphaerae bacterium]
AATEPAADDDNDPRRPAPDGGRQAGHPACRGGVPVRRVRPFQAAGGRGYQYRSRIGTGLASGHGRSGRSTPGTRRRGGRVRHRLRHREAAVARGGPRRVRQGAGGPGGDGQPAPDGLPRGRAGGPQGRQADPRLGPGQLALHGHVRAGVAGQPLGQPDPAGGEPRVVADGVRRVAGAVRRVRVEVQVDELRDHRDGAPGARRVGRDRGQAGVGPVQVRPHAPQPVQQRPGDARAPGLRLPRQVERPGDGRRPEPEVPAVHARAGARRDRDEQQHRQHDEGHGPARAEHVRRAVRLRERRHRLPEERRGALGPPSGRVPPVHDVEREPVLRTRRRVEHARAAGRGRAVPRVPDDRAGAAAVARPRVPPGQPGGAGRVRGQPVRRLPEVRPARRPPRHRLRAAAGRGRPQPARVLGAQQRAV